MSWNTSKIKINWDFPITKNTSHEERCLREYNYWWSSISMTLKVDQSMIPKTLYFLFSFKYQTLCVWGLLLRKSTRSKFQSRRCLFALIYCLYKDLFLRYSIIHGISTIWVHTKVIIEHWCIRIKECFQQALFFPKELVTTHHHKPFLPVQVLNPTNIPPPRNHLMSKMFVF